MTSERDTSDASGITQGHQRLKELTATPATAYAPGAGFPPLAVGLAEAHTTTGPKTESITISLVLHEQADMAQSLLDDLAHHCASEPLNIALTLNVAEALPFDPAQFPFPIRVVRNRAPKGFSANHNAALMRADGETGFFCVLNPDLRIVDNPFPALRQAAATTEVGIAAPLVRDPEGEVADNARRVPTPKRLAARYLRRRNRRLEYSGQPDERSPEWVAGMCLFMRSEVFRELGGFDEKFYLYMEDVDICLRARFRGYDVALVPEAEIIHQARRQSHRHGRYLLWHLSSLARFYGSTVFLRYLLRGAPRVRVR